jgi:Ca2+-binding RTX toxin-like protein
VEQVLFGDGTLWNRSQIFDAAWIRGTSGVDTLSGGNDAETFDGAGGNDPLYGGAGSDTYIYRVGSGKMSSTNLLGTREPIQRSC